MLSLLHIENIAIIESADIRFDGGFNVLTGETGAGKSIVIDAIGAVLGERTSRELTAPGPGRRWSQPFLLGSPSSDGWRITAFHHRGRNCCSNGRSRGTAGMYAG